jgi:hypothetical protein
MTTRLRWSYGIAISLVVAMHIAVAVPSVFDLRLWEDEAFNLSVPLNLLRGLGYTSDGTLSGSELTPFDARISTGPVVLLPIAAVIGLGADMVIGGRLVVLACYAALLLGAWMLGRRIGGLWAGLVAVTVPLALLTNQPPSPIQGPADVLGEIPAAALLVWALYVSRDRPWLGGLLLGLAVQSKFIAVLAVPALTIAVFFAVDGQSFGQRAKRVLPAAAFAVVPTLLFELFRLVSLGPAGYLASVRSFAQFVVGGGQQGVRVSPEDKLGLLLESWYVHPLVVVAVVVICIGLGLLAFAILRREPDRFARVAHGLAAGGHPLESGRQLRVLLAAASAGVATYAVWWMLSVHTPAWIRHPAPGWLTFVPVLAAYVVLAVAVLLHGTRVIERVGAVAAAAAVGVSLVWACAAHVAAAGGADGESLGDQRAVAVAIGSLELETDWLAGRWGTAVSVIVLAGSHAALTDAGPVVADYPRVWWGQPGEDCEAVLMRMGEYTVCPAPARADGN